MAKRVLPQPAEPQSKVGRPLGKPPSVISSSPAMPVGHFSIEGIARDAALALVEFMKHATHTELLGGRFPKADSCTAAK
jgi:hypothetical protein